MKIKILLTFTFLMISLPLPALSASKKSSNLEYVVKASYLYNFTKFIQWPEGAISEKQGEFLIGVVGDNPFGKSLKALSAKKKVNSRKLVIKRFSSVEEIGACQILFVSSSQKDNLEKILTKFGKLPMLLVGDTAGFAKRGVGINFYIKKNKVRIEFNRESLEKSGLKISSRLLNVGRIVK